MLDLGFAARLGPFPEVTAALVGRAMDRSRGVAGHLVLAQPGSVEHRVQLALWHMADVWGHVSRDGVQLPLPLTHAIIGARRPAVTTALGTLERRASSPPSPATAFG